MHNFMVVGATIEDVESNPSEFIDIFREHGLIGFRDSNCVDPAVDPIRLLDAFAQELSWTPHPAQPDGSLSGSWGYLQQYDDVLAEREVDVSEDLIQWHIEGISKLRTQAAAAWFMYKFSAAPGTGSTGFVDMSKLLDKMPDNFREIAERAATVHYPPFPSTTEDIESFRTQRDNLRNVLAVPAGDGRDVLAFPRQVVEHHPDFGFDVLRLCPCREWFGCQHHIYSIDGERPEANDLDLFFRMQDWVNREIVSVKENQIFWDWAEGDVVIPDLFRMAHGVRGGFTPGQRYFQGYWAFPVGVAQYAEYFADPDSANVNAHE